MSGCSSQINFSTSAMRARTELIFQEAIFRRFVTMTRLLCDDPE
jgi:hypothetical protein